MADTKSLWQDYNSSSSMNTQPLALIIAAVIGSVSSIFGGLLSNWLIACRDRLQWERERSKNKEEWLRSQKQEAYHNAIRYLLRALNRRSGMTLDGQCYLSSDDVTVWISDLIEAQTALSTLTIYSGVSDPEPIRSVTAKLDKSIQSMVWFAERLDDNQINCKSSNLGEETTEILMESVKNAYAVVLQDAKLDLGMNSQ